MEIDPPPFVLWTPLYGGKLVCFSFADGTMSEPFSSQGGGRIELLDAVQHEKVTSLQAQWLEHLIQKHTFSRTYPPSALASRSALVRDIGVVEDVDNMLVGMPEHLDD